MMMVLNCVMMMVDRALRFVSIFRTVTLNRLGDSFFGRVGKRSKASTHKDVVRTVHVTSRCIQNRATAFHWRSPARCHEDMVDLVRCATVVRMSCLCMFFGYLQAANLFRSENFTSRDPFSQRWPSSDPELETGSELLTNKHYLCGRRVVYTS